MTLAVVAILFAALCVHIYVRLVGTGAAQR